MSQRLCNSFFLLQKLLLLPALIAASACAADYKRPVEGGDYITRQMTFHALTNNMRRSEKEYSPVQPYDKDKVYIEGSASVARVDETYVQKLNVRFNNRIKQEGLHLDYYHSDEDCLIDPEDNDLTASTPPDYPSLRLSGQ